MEYPVAQIGRPTTNPSLFRLTRTVASQRQPQYLWPRPRPRPRPHPHPRTAPCHAIPYHTILLRMPSHSPAPYAHKGAQRKGEGCPHLWVIPLGECPTRSGTTLEVGIPYFYSFFFLLFFSPVWVETSFLPGMVTPISLVLGLCPNMICCALVAGPRPGRFAAFRPSQQVSVGSVSPAWPDLVGLVGW